MNRVIVVRDWDAEAFHRRVLELEAQGYAVRLESYSIKPEMNPADGIITHVYTIEMNKNESGEQ